MGFSIDTYGLPYIRDYKRALEHYNNIKPIRGRTIRPIIPGRWGRRKQHMRIELTRDVTPRSNGEFVTGVACVLYNTQVVTFFEDGTSRYKSGGYNTQSTAKFMENFGPGYLSVGQGGNTLIWRDGSNGYLKIEGELWMEVRPDPAHPDEPARAYRQPINPEPFVVHAIDRKAKKEVMKDYAAFMDYAIGLGRLTNWDKPEGDVASDRYIHEWMTSEDIDDHVRAYKVAVRSCGRRLYMWNNGNPGSYWHCNEAMFKRWMTEVVMREHGDKILVRKELPIGEYKKDPNYRWARINRMV